MTLGDLNLAQGDSQAARAILVSCYTSTRGKADGGAMFCLERLADYRHRLYDPQTTLGWTCVYIGAARKTGNKLALMKGLACIAEIFIAWGDDSTALSILEVTLSRFTYMGVHRWRADCFERMGEIYERRGQLVKACELWTSARPLFERSSQAQAVARLDSRLASDYSSEMKSRRRNNAGRDLFQTAMGRISDSQTIPAAHAHEASPPPTPLELRKEEMTE
ncbi:hypothetical protein C8J57DRAFT_1242321 [Mycena rebaudengoi]|nr:hypothetical protein C8J57DRAFT_1242321 [Mycena rebaudengoi]